MLPASLHLFFYTNLLNSTDDGSLKWSEQHGFVRTARNGVDVSIRYVEYEYEPNEFLVWVHRDGGDRIEYDVSENDDDYSNMRGLYASARTNAHNLHNELIEAFQ